MEYFKRISSMLSYCLDYILFNGWLAVFGDKLEVYHKRSNCNKRHCKNCRVQSVVKRIKRAKFHVVLAIMTISHKTLCKALMEARLRGVQVRIATPKKMLSARDLVTRQLLMYIHSVDHSEVPIIKCVFLDGNRIILRMDDELLLLMRRLLIDENLFSYYFWYFGYLWHGEYFEPLDIPTAA